MAKAKAEKKKKVSLRFEGEAGKEIFVAGAFNNWTVEETKKNNKAKKLKEEKGKTGTYIINMFLPVGEYEYKFYSNGQWLVDPNSEVHKQNSFGTFNSVLKVA